MCVFHRPRQQPAGGVVSQIHCLTRLDDLGRDPEVGVPGGGRRHSITSSVSLGFRFDQTAGVVSEVRHVTIGIGMACPIAVVVVGVGLCGGGHFRGGGLINLGDPWCTQRGLERISLRESQGIDVCHRPIAVVRQGDGINACGMFARIRETVRVIGPGRKPVAVLISNAGECVRIGCILVVVGPSGIVGAVQRRGVWIDGRLQSAIGVIPVTEGIACRIIKPVQYTVGIVVDGQRAAGEMRDPIQVAVCVIGQRDCLAGAVFDLGELT